MVVFYMKECSYFSCNTDCNRWIRTHYGQYQECVQRHHWKILLAGLAFLGLCWLGFKSMDFERDLMKLWIYNSSRLHNETSYISKRIDGGSTETIIQVTKDDILTRSMFLEHLQLLSILVHMEVKYDGKVFTLQHFCRQIQLPRMQYLGHNIRTDMENLMPCEIVTPLHCFWEGSFLLNNGHYVDTSSANRYSSKKFDWSTSDFQYFLNGLKGMSYEEFFVTLFNETGFGQGYISKPCLDHSDLNCPRRNEKDEDLRTVLQNGCFLLAENLYNYPRTLLIGEQSHALQSMIFLRSAADVLQTMKTNDLDWTEDKVRHVMGLWQSSLRQKVIKYNKQRPYLKSELYNDKLFQSRRTERSSFYAFTNTSLSAALASTDADETMVIKYLLCGGLLMLLGVILFLSSNDPVRSHCWLAISGTLLVTAAIISGLGLSATMGLKFSVLTVQVVPFLTLALGMDDLLILTGAYAHSIDRYFLGDVSVHPVYRTLCDCATVILLSFFTKVSVVAAVLLVPVPLMQNFCEQVLLIVLVQTGTSVFLYPCLLYLDSQRQLNNRVDFLCCLVKQLPHNETKDDQVPLPKYDLSPSTSSQVIFSTEFTTSTNDLVPDNVRQYVEITPIPMPGLSTKVTPRLSAERGNPRSHQTRCFWKYRYRFSRTFVQIIALLPVHITVVIVAIVIIFLGVYSAISVNFGLKFDSIFIRDSNEYNYIKHQTSEFRLNNFYVLTKEIDYVNSQDLVLQLNDHIKAVTSVEVFGNGRFWLSSLIGWLERLQIDFDNDVRQRLILTNGTWFMNASKNGLMAMTLLVQDRDSINYKKLGSSRLVQSHHVDRTNFYLYLNVWRSVSYDYDAIPCILYPQMAAFNMDYFIPNTQRPEPQPIRMSGKNLFTNNPLQFVACKYFHRGVNGHDDLSLVKTIRSITESFSDKGVHCSPLGNVFSLSEQYFSLRSHILIAILVSLLSLFIVALLTMNHFMVSVIISIVLLSSLLGTFCFLSIYDLPLNGSSGVMVLWSGGLGLRFSLFFIVSYAEQSVEHPTGSTSEDVENMRGCTHASVSRPWQSRVLRAIDLSPCGSVLLSTLLSSSFISMTNVTFIWEHFLLLPLVGLIHSLFQCYCLSPVLCVYLLPSIAPMPIVLDRPHTPRPISKPRSQYKCRPRNPGLQSSTNNRDSDDGKLSTIAEESGSIESSTETAPPSQSQEPPRFVEQKVESSLTVNCPSVSNATTDPSLSLHTSFKYQHLLNQRK